jgi:Domain of unknown function (DUF4352)
MTSDGPPPQYPPPPPSGYPQEPPPNQPPVAPGQFPGQFPGQQPGQFPGQQFNGPSPGNQPWSPSAGYQPPPLRDLGGYNRPPQQRRGRRVLGAIGTVIGALVVAGVIGAVVTHSSNSSKVTVSVPPLSFTFASLAPAPAPGPASAATASGAAQPATGAAGPAGSTITIKGQESGEKLAVTLLKVAPTTTATDGFSTPPSGDRYFAAQFKLTNTGTSAYTDSADNDAVALDAGGKQYQTDIVASIAAGPLFSDQLNIAPGATSSGWIVFDVPTATAITSIEFTTDSGFGDTGRWTIQ